ncbi:MAG: hypothetical protein PHV33_12630 [Elusimicrobiales bacterium]|nr:hypothetical protein [Elusimicrobiales bacterium]
MHLLPGILGLLLLAAPCAADERLEPFFGYWTGELTASPGGCEWKVKVRFTPSGESLRGSFTYSGPCSKAPGAGSFNANQQDGPCLQAMVSIPGLPGMNGEACFSGDGALVFKSGLATGRLTLSEGDTRADLEAASPLGSAEGVFNKVPQKKPKKATVKGKAQGKKDAKKVKPVLPEVLIGSY